jgi:hypothetical protein
VTAIAARLHSAGRREYAVAAAAAVTTAFLWAATPALVASQSAIGSFPASGFDNGMTLPVRAIQRPISHILSLTAVSRDRFVRVQCAGRAKRTSDCWVFRP